jgi:hypothetical protein
MIGTLLAWLLTIGMALLGVVACLAPRPTSALYGVPQDDRAGFVWVRAAGLRDLGLAAALAVFLAQGWPEAAATLSLATALVAVGDFAGVLALRGSAAALQLSVHASGVALGLAAGVLLFQ